MEEIQAEWFSVKTVREVAGFVAVGVAVGIYGLASAIRHKWISLSANAQTTTDLAVAKSEIAHRDEKISELNDEITQLKAKLEAASGE